MRVGIIGPAPPLRGGIAAHTAGLARTFRELGHDVKVLSFSRLYPRGLFPGRSQENGHRPIGESLLDSLDPLSWWRGRRWVEGSGVDLLLVQWWHPVTTPATLACLPSDSGIPVVVVGHNARPHEWFPADRLLLRSLLRRTAGVICHSRHVARALASMIADRPVRTVPMPHLLSPVALQRHDRSGLLTRLGFHEDDRMVLFPGHLRRYKGVAVLLDAWSSADLPGAAVLMLAGESYLDQARLSRMVARGARRNRIRRSDCYLRDETMIDLLTAAECIVLPYTSGSQSGWAPLARASGHPVIVSDAGGLTEEFADYAPALRVRCGDARELAAALSQVLGAAPARRNRPLPESAAMRQARSEFDRRWFALASACVALAREARGRLPRPIGKRRESLGSPGGYEALFKRDKMARRTARKRLQGDVR